MGFHIEGNFVDNFVITPKTIAEIGENFVENGDSIVNQPDSIVNGIVNQPDSIVNSIEENEENGETSKIRAMILELMRSNPKISATKIAEVIGIAPRNAQAHISILKQKGLVERVGSTRGHWVVKPPD